jgi:adenosylcobyric acid synthase
MTETILVAGTGSHVGKSVLSAGLARWLADRGLSVVPFKAQNMSNNARVVVSPSVAGSDGTGERSPSVEGSDGTGERSPSVDGSDGTGEEADGTGQSSPNTSTGTDPAPESSPAESVTESAGPEYGEIGVSQYVQARAAGVTPTTDMNPVLLKPRGDGESQLVIDGQAREHLEPGAYYGGRWDDARAAAEAAYRRLAAEYDVVVAEGAGSIAEINLHDRDLANVETARFADASIILVADIERGGVFASLWGTLELMPEDCRERVAGVVINKFRGSRDVLEPGIEEFEAMADVPVLGVVPYEDPGLPEEDSVSLPAAGERTVLGDDDGAPPEATVTVGVPRIPFISNFTDLEPLAMEPGVRVAYLPLETDLADVDAVVLPGSKNTVDDLLALQDAGFDRTIAAFDGPVVGICGGYQMLGERLHRVGIESTRVSGSIDGLGLLPVETTFSPEKVVTRTTCEVSGVGPIAGATGTASGYEIHMGTASFREDVAHPLDDTSAVVDSVLGTYLHGLFENRGVRRAFVETVFEHAGRTPPGAELDLDSPFERAAALVEEYVDLERANGLDLPIY